MGSFLPCARGKPLLPGEESAVALELVALLLIANLPAQVQEFQISAKVTTLPRALFAALTFHREML
jgi:hypothetical protein